jgi:hypothetical protein
MASIYHWVKYNVHVDLDISFIFSVVGAGGNREAISGEADQTGEDSESCEE